MQIDNIDILEQKILSSYPNKKDIIKINGDGNCAYNPIFRTLGEKIDIKNLRNETANYILCNGISLDIYEERNSNSLIEYT